jgi:hypothetical protein
LTRGAVTLLALVLLAACGGSPSPAATRPSPTPTATPSPSPTLDVGALAAAAAGTYAGNWKNTTFGSTGTVTAVISVDRATLTVSATITLTGNVFGGSAPPPETFTGQISNLGSMGFSGHSPTFGDFTVTANGPAFVMKAQNVPNARIDHFEADGTFAGSSIGCTYKVFFKDGTTADGTCSLTKQ